MISVILPTFNEMRHGYISRIAAQLATRPGLEVIVVDSGSSDGTPDLLAEHGFRVERIPPTNRAMRLNHGINLAQGDILFLHHPRSLPDPEAFSYLEENSSELTWGGLTQCFDENHPLLRFTSWYSNEIRGRRSGIVYLDHCIFVARRLWPGGYQIPNVDVFEDTLLSQRLRQIGPPEILAFRSLTSAVRFRQNGIYQQSALNQACKVALHLGVAPNTINRFYERTLQFNLFAKH